ncbi:MAG: hypothetical protein C0394_01725 [Syntrophus sp. (in: bacteria)]|nr:hypothetical protein [Syntrophus sp. (in: bacteria)]
MNQKGGGEKAFRISWSRLIQKIYEIDPLVCPKYRGAMLVIGSIEDPSIPDDDSQVPVHDDHA